MEAPRHFTSGDILRWRRVGGLLLAEVQFEPGQRIHRDAHPHVRFMLVLKGSLPEPRGDEPAATYGPSTLLFRRADEPRSYAASDRGAACLIVDVDPAWARRAAGPRAA